MRVASHSNTPSTSASRTLLVLIAQAPHTNIRCHQRNSQQHAPSLSPAMQRAHHNFKLHASQQTPQLYITCTPAASNTEKQTLYVVVQCVDSVIVSAGHSSQTLTDFASGLQRQEQKRSQVSCCLHAAVRSHKRLPKRALSSGPHQCMHMITNTQTSASSICALPALERPCHCTPQRDLPHKSAVLSCQPIGTSEVALIICHTIGHRWGLSYIGCCIAQSPQQPPRQCCMSYGTKQMDSVNLRCPPSSARKWRGLTFTLYSLECAVQLAHLCNIHTRGVCMLVWICLARLIVFDRCPLGVPCLSVYTHIHTRQLSTQKGRQSCVQRPTDPAVSCQDEQLRVNAAEQIAWPCGGRGWSCVTALLRQRALPLPSCK